MTSNIKLLSFDGNCYGGYLNASLGKNHEYYRFVDFFFELINGPLEVVFCGLSNASP